MSVDHKLYLWNFEEEDILIDLEMASMQSIVSVGIAKPKRGIFKDIVEWCLVVSTLDEVMLCALVLCSGKLSIVPTRYTIPTDDIPIVSICGISDGRIFMGGYDGSLYEFDYQSLVSGSQPPKTIEQRLQDYYDGTATSIQLKDSSPAFQAMRKGKRAFVSLLGGSECPQKCPSTGPLEKIVHDAERQCMYTLAARGFISIYDMRGKDLTVNASIDWKSLARQYLSAVAKEHMFAPSPSIDFVGGGASAQAGIGGMDGARSILKLATDVRTRVLTPISLHVLPHSDSSRLTLLAVTAGCFVLPLSRSLK